MRSRSFAVAALLAIALSACSSDKSTVDLGLKRITLDLAFKNPSKAVKPPTIAQVLVAQEPAAVATQLFGELSQRGSAVLRPPLFTVCSTAAKGALPEVPVSGVPSGPPAPGIYTQHNSGTFDLSGPLALKGAFPPIGQMEVVAKGDTTTLDAAGGEVRTITYDVINRNLIATTTTRYQSIVRALARRIGPTSAGPISSELELVSIETKVGTDVTTFRPTPPITLMQYGGEAAQWVSAGTDQETGTAMVVTGIISRREPIDVCGKMIDTYRVESTERITNIVTGYTSMTAADDPNVYNVATQFGGLLVRQHTATTSTFTSAGLPATLVINNTSTVDSVTPRSQ
jgi:hypothetical protein